MLASSAERRVIGLVNAASKCPMHVAYKTMANCSLVAEAAAADVALDPDHDQDQDPAEDQGRSTIFNLILKFLSYT